MALTEDSIAVTQQQVAGLGELGLAAAPIEQGHLQLLLEVLNLQADSRLRDVKTVRGLLEAALADDRPQDAQLIKRERQIGHGGPRTAVEL